MLHRNWNTAVSRPCPRYAKVKRSRKEVGLELASLLVDHSNLETTRGYANIDEEELEEAAIKTSLKIDLWK